MGEDLDSVGSPSRSAVLVKKRNSSFFTRWGWPLFSLAAWVVFELTANLILSSLVFAFRFGWKDAFAGFCCLYKDSVRSRARGLLLFHLSSATSKVFTVSFLSLLILVLISALSGGHLFFLQFKDGVMVMVWEFLGGMLASGILGLSGVLTCRLSGRRLWIDRESYQHAIGFDWPPQDFTSNRIPRICFFTMIPVAAVFVWLTVYMPLVVFVDPLKKNPAPWQFVLPLVSGIASVWFFMFGVFGIIRSVTARTPFECWPELLELPIEDSLEILESIELPNGGMGIHKEFDRKTRSQ